MASPQLQELIAGMRAGSLDFGAPPEEVRTVFDALLAGMPAPEGVTFNQITLGGVSALECAHAGDTGAGTILYFHGGGYIAGSAHGYRGLPAALALAAGIGAVAIDYRLAPEHPFPAAVDDGVAAFMALLERGVDPAHIIFAGDSAGGGLVVSSLIKLRDAGEPLPAAALLLSPFADLSCEGDSFESKAAEDPSLTASGLRAGAQHYLGGLDAKDPVASPVHGNLSGLPPIMIQVGSAEILLDDALGLARAAGMSGTQVRLDVWPEMIHVWQSFAFMLPEGAAAIDDAAAFISANINKE